MNSPYFGNYFEDFFVGQEFSHAISKTIFESDNNLFSLLTMNHHPVHTNEHYARQEKHGRILVVGTLVFSITVGMTVQDISGKAIANLNYENIDHKAPVFIGDTIYARTTVLETRPSKSNSTAGIVRVETKGYNQDGVDVISFIRNVLIKRRMHENAQ